MILRLLLVVGLLAGCASAEPVPLADDDIELAAALKPFDDCDALTERVREHALSQVGPYGLQNGMMAGDDGAAQDRVAAAPQSLAAESAESVAGAGGFSTTNVQEAGVDEADVAKTDGSYLYTVVDGTLRIVDVRQDEPTVAASVSLGEGLGREVLLLDDQLLVIGDVSAVPTDRRSTVHDMELIAPWPPRTRLWLVDIANPTQPDITSTMTLDGWTVATRLTGEIARVVVRSGLTPPDLEVPTSSGREAEQRALEANRKAIRNSDAEDWLPRVEVDGGSSEPLVECQAVHEPPGFTDLATVTVLSLDMQSQNLSPDRTQAVLGAADAVYANDERLYVSTSRWPFRFPGPLPVDPVPLPAPVPEQAPEQAPEPAPLPTTADSVPPEPLPEPVPDPATEPLPKPVPDPSTERMPEPSTPALRQPTPKVETVSTEVHRFDLDGMNVDYAASGSVPGSLLNQWALSEHNGDLRIATTEEQLSGQASHSAVRVLRQRGGELREIGHVGDLGRGERIYAVRYAGDIGFVVTFRQVDPLYVVDLSDPTDPQVLGELKIPGYSAYLHPIGDNHLLGVGQHATRDGRTTGVQVSLFDVADRMSPRRIDQVRLGRDTMTSVEYDHRAFLYWPDEQLAVLPVDAWSQGKSGATVLTVDPAGGVAERGMVQHPPRDGAPAPVQRAFVVDDRLITVSPVDVLVSDLETLDSLGDVPFAE